MISHQIHFSNEGFLAKCRLESFLTDKTRENTKGLEHSYHPGYHVIDRRPTQFRKDEGDGGWVLPYSHCNGTVIVESGATQQRLSIRHIFRATGNASWWRFDIPAISFFSWIDGWTHVWWIGWWAYLIRDEGCRYSCVCTCCLNLHLGLFMTIVSTVGFVGSSCEEDW